MKYPKFIKVNNAKDAVKLEGKTIYVIRDKGLHMELDILDISKIEPAKKKSFQMKCTSIIPESWGLELDLTIDEKKHIQNKNRDLYFFENEIDALKYARDVTKERKKAMTQDLSDWNRTIQDLTTACE